MHITREDIQRNFDPGTVARGADYAARGKVVSVGDSDEGILGEVRGSGRNVYHQTIRVTPGRHGLAISAYCSCPITSNCKHAVAVLLAALARPVTPLSVPPAARMPDGAVQWLNQLAVLRDDASAAPQAPSHRFYCVLAPSERSSVPCLYLAKAKLRADGSISGATLNRDTYTVLNGYLQPDDEELVRLVAALRAGAMYAEPEIEITGRLGARLLLEACERGRLFRSATVSEVKRGWFTRVTLGPPRRAALQWRPADGDSDAVALKWVCDDGGPAEYVLRTDPPCYLDYTTVGRIEPAGELAALPPDALHRLVEHAPRLGPHQRAAMAATLAERGLDRLLPLPEVVETRTVSGIAPTPHLLLDCAWIKTRWRDSVADYARLSFDYDGLSTEGCADAVLRRSGGGVVELIERDAAAERAAASVLAGMGFAAAPPGSDLARRVDEALELPGQDEWVLFVRRDLPRLRNAGWQIEYGGGFRYEVAEAEDWYADLEEEGEGASAWFSLELGILVDGERHPLLPLLLDMIRAAPHNFSPAALAARPADSEVIGFLKDGRMVALPWQRVKPILDTLGELYFGEVGKAIRLPYMDAARLAELEAAARMRWLGGERLRELGRKLNDFEGIRPVEPPAGLNAQLREYQRTGLAWMQFLREYGFAGILADDMGLGKTIQTLAHILLEKEAGRLDRPAMVVAPTSLMGNWQAEAARFAPGLRVLLLHGKDRKDQFEQIPQADLVLTTYPLLGRDEAALRQHRYHLLILDEAQYIKNSRAKAAQTARLLDARHRLCLTGTPVQNHLGELWSQFHFLMPGLLGDEKTFNAQVRKPIELGADARRQAWLARRVKPFMLRRTKDKVATELPPKTEIVFPVDLGSVQRDLYETVRLAMDKKVRDAIDAKGVAKSQIIILDALLKLRQACCDPRLLKHEGGSAKLEALMELLDTLLSEGRKVLVFSQFTSMLALIEEELRARSVGYLLLTGETGDRAERVAAFQSGQASIFLISLKAGGVGLNLTAADTVIHYDPWWNPASENQATDRAWRIGQEQPVFVYKLIARGTVEEKIQELQRRKDALANAVLDAEGGAAAAIGADDLRELFAPPPA